MKYQLTGSVQLAGKTAATVRTTIEASSPQEAEEKFKAFLLRKAEPVVISCQLEPADDFGKIMEMFGKFFGSK
jgi:hypothetical protein